MSKIIRLIQSYLIFGLPFVLICMLWQTFQSPNETATGMLRVVWTILGCNLMFWFAMLIVFLSILVIVPSVRDKTLRRLASIKERDEREQYITGRAARMTYISTLSLTILLLFLSVFSLNIPKKLGSEGENHKHSASISLAFSLFEESSAKNLSKEEVLFDSNTIRLSQPAILLMLLIWQIVIFNFAARKEQEK